MMSRLLKNVTKHAQLQRAVELDSWKQVELQRQVELEKWKQAELQR